MYRYLSQPLVSLYFQTEAGWEEFYDYIFPDDSAAQPNLKLLAMAKMWKTKQENQAGGEGNGKYRGPCLEKLSLLPSQE